MAVPLSRREFLKLSGSAAFGMAFSGALPDLKALLAGEAERLGRMIRSQRIYERPSFTSNSNSYYPSDSVFKILEEKTGDGKDAPLLVAHNLTWVRTERGWVHSSYVQPVRQEFQIPILEVPANGFLAEVTVPWVQVYKLNDDNKKKAYRLYYACTAWVLSAYTDWNGVAWYRILDDLDKSSAYVVARNLRRMEAGEVAPISPEVLDKRIDVDLTAQQAIAFENGLAINSVRVATGNPGIATPVGEFRIERKQPIRHMTGQEGGPGDVGYYDLPGVPWVCFISWNGVSLHGTYWHNNYGRPQSHGCINMTPEAARWFYRWSSPVVPIEKDYIGKAQGTRVSVHF